MSFNISENNQQQFITYTMPGGAPEYVAQLQALRTAISGAPLSDDCRETLGNMLAAMLPAEDQIICQQHNK